MAEKSRIFMQLTSPKSGPIKGESIVSEREGWIELDNWGWSLGRSSSDDAIPEPSLLTFDKIMDRSTTAMLKAMLDGDQLRAKIVVDDSSLSLMELSITLEHVTIREYDFSTKTSEKGGSVDEDWTFDYRWITFEYQADSKSGVKSIKLHRPQTASNSKPPHDESKKFRKLGGSLLASGMSLSSLTEIWDEIVKSAETAQNRPGGQSLTHATQTPEDD